MKPDQERVKTLLSQTVTLLCKNGLHYEKELRIQGLLGITIDCESVFIVHFNESLSDFTSDVVSPLMTGATSVESCDEKAVKSRSAAISASKPSSTLCSETDAEKSCSSLDETRKPSPLDESGQLPSENVETLLTLDDDLKTVKTEQNSEEDDGEDVVLVESENEQDIGSLASTLFPTPCNESVDSRMKRDRRLRQHLLPVSHGNKRRRLALPAPIENMSGYSDDGGNYNVKMEPMSSEYLGGSEQNLTYEEGYPEHSWDNSKTVFSQTEAVEELTSVPGCSSWDGFDLQAQGLTSSSAVPRSNELYHESWTYAKFERRGTTPAQAALSHASVSSHDNSVALRQGGAVSTYRRSRGGATVKTVVCQYPDCGKTFCHSYHLYRHQREKHGRRFGVISQMSFMCRFPECGRVFYRMASLWNHENLVHNVAPSAT